MYTDEGISGTSIKKRLGFQEMIEDAKSGIIDLILTKSLSRFARNTVDCLTTVRELRDINVEVYFEKENIYSSDPKIDFMLTIFSSIAQEESRNISENIKWGFRKRFKEGIVHINTSRFLGYDKDENGKIIINGNEANTVRKIFNLYISGSSLREICKYLTENKIPNGRKEVNWSSATINNILTNEKYCGDAILQKRVTIDYLSHKSVKNTGQAPKYYIENNHEAIIPRKMFKFTQELKKVRGSTVRYSNYGNMYPLSGLVICSQCGQPMNRHYYSYGKPSQRVVLSCKNRYRDKRKCYNLPTDNSTLELAITDSIKKLHLYKEKTLEETLKVVKSNLSTKELDSKISETQDKVKIIENDLREIIEMNLETLENSSFYIDLYKEKKEILKELRSDLKKYNESLIDNHIHNERISKIHDFLKDYIPINREILRGTYAAIISLTRENYIFVMSDISLKPFEVLNHLKSIKKCKPIIQETITSKDNKFSINYKVVRLEEKNASSKNN